MRKLTLTAMALAAGTVIGSPASHADLLLSGSIWLDQPTLASNATIAGAPTTPADVTFLARDLNFHADVTHGTVGDWLDSAAATCLTGCDAATLGRTFGDSYSLFHGTTNLDLGTSHFTIAHDDGVQLDILGIPGLEVDNPTPPATTTNFDVTTTAAGNYDFVLSYGECCGLPARLLSDLPEARVPEPASLALLGTALAGFGIMRRRRKTG